MNGIIVNIDPVLLYLGHIEIRWYSIIILLAVIAAVVISIIEAKKKGFKSDDIFSLVPWVLIGGVIGARLFHVVDKWGYYVANPSQILAIQQGGLAIWGALAGGGVAVVAYALLKRISLGRLVDVLTPGLITAQIIGRFACIINGDAAGGITTLSWGFIYVNPASMIPSNLYGIPTHPYPVYEMLWNIGVLVLLLKVRRYMAKDGLLFLSYLSLYSIGRFLLTFVRQENIWFWGLQEAQVISIFIFVISTIMFVYLWRRTQRKEHSEPAKDMENRASESVNN